MSAGSEPVPEFVDENRRRLTRDECVALLARPVAGVFSSISASGWIHSVPVFFHYTEGARAQFRIATAQKPRCQPGETPRRLYPDRAIRTANDICIVASRAAGFGVGILTGAVSFNASYHRFTHRGGADNQRWPGGIVQSGEPGVRQPG